MPSFTQAAAEFKPSESGNFQKIKPKELNQGE
jgi:hypothetical protein